LLGKEDWENPEIGPTNELPVISGELQPLMSRDWLPTR